MIRKLIWNDMKQNRLSCAATIFFMAVSAMLLALAVLLCSGLLGAIDNLMDRSQVPDYMQMHTGSDIFAKPGGSRMGSAAEALSSFAGEREEVRQWQICRFLNLDNSRITLGGRRKTGCQRYCRGRSMPRPAIGPCMSLRRGISWR